MKKIAGLSAPTELTQNMVKKIGQSYLEKYPESTAGIIARCRSTIFPHHNHNHAKQLINEVNNCQTYADNWRLLFKIYQSLPNNNGSLASNILNHFESAFNVKLDKATAAGTITIDKTTATIAGEMEGHLSAFENKSSFELTTTRPQS